jgi:hypothetical protein
LKLKVIGGKGRQDAGPCFIREGYIMAKKKRGIYAEAKGTPKGSLDDKVADFSYENDSLAALIVEWWTGGLANLTSGSFANRTIAAQAALAARGIYFDYPIVITETEYDDGFNLEDADLPSDKGIVFVLPRKERVTAGKPLLESAKMLMAITPNGI